MSALNLDTATARIKGIPRRRLSDIKKARNDGYTWKVIAEATPGQPSVATVRRWIEAYEVVLDADRAKRAAKAKKTETKPVTADIPTPEKLAEITGMSDKKTVASKHDKPAEDNLVGMASVYSTESRRAVKLTAAEERMTDENLAVTLYGRGVIVRDIADILSCDNAEVRAILRERNAKVAA